MSDFSVLTPDMVLAFHRDAFNGSLLMQDYATLRRVYDDSYMLVRPSGEQLSKQTVLDDLEKGSLTFLSIRLDDEDVRIYGTTAVLTAVSSTHTRRGKSEARDRVRLVAVYTVVESTLRLVHYQSTNLPPEGAQE